ncbi:hypothetical protein [Halovivax gelatinilyticus]|uniref:hypothetical protein n=1 Tax=Halovivax gelatinilyticus TaxID=2961597 RepID=UPI0020CA687D|nr:hypothetical protein [Halovivax gelatinilyticus]
MSGTDRVSTFLTHAGGYELCTALLESSRTRQQLITMIDVPERTLDRRLTEGETVGVIKPVPTTSTELVFTVNKSAIPDHHRQIIDDLAAYFQIHPTDENFDDIELHRRKINGIEQPFDAAEITAHADVPGGDTTFY